jgi:spore coat polysaccharide biosynthesis protein SpsF (cytidylyltransferase family)
MITFFHNHKNEFKINFVPNLNDITHLRYTLDRKEDLKLIQEIFARIKKRPILKNDILKLFFKNRELFDINKHLDANEGQIYSSPYSKWV